MRYPSLFKLGWILRHGKFKQFLFSWDFTYNYISPAFNNLSSKIILKHIVQQMVFTKTTDLSLLSHKTWNSKDVI